MLELDRLLSDFLDARYDQLNAEQTDQLMTLLTVEDDRLWDWLSGRVPPDSDSGTNALVEQILQYHRTSGPT